MARVSVTLTVPFAVLFFFLTLSHALIPEILPENDVVVGGRLPNSLPDSDVSSIIRLPSDTVHADPDGETKQSEQPVTIASVPLSLVSFRPLNRHFRSRSRFSSRPCHHHHLHNNGLVKPMMRQQVEVPYGDDMILSSGENGDFDPMMFHPGVRRTPVRWVRFHHHHHRHHDDEDVNGGPSKFVFKHSDRFGKEKFKRHWRHENAEENGEEKHDEKVKKNEDGGFMKRIRKILDHF